MLMSVPAAYQALMSHHGMMPVRLLRPCWLAVIARQMSVAQGQGGFKQGKLLPEAVNTGSLMERLRGSVSGRGQRWVVRELSVGRLPVPVAREHVGRWLADPWEIRGSTDAMWEAGGGGGRRTRVTRGECGWRQMHTRTEWGQGGSAVERVGMSSGVHDQHKGQKEEVETSGGVGGWRARIGGGGGGSGVGARRERVGLYGYEELREAKGFKRMAEEAVADCSHLLSEAARCPPGLHTVQLLDDMSDVLCRVMDAAELCRNTHPDREFVGAAHAAYLHVSQYVQELNSSPQLYRLLVAAMQHLRGRRPSSKAPPPPPPSHSHSHSHSHSQPHGLSGSHDNGRGWQAGGQQCQEQQVDSRGGGVEAMVMGRERGRGEVGKALGMSEEEEAFVVAEALLLDFERGGVQLEDAQRMEVQHIMSEITETCVSFTHNINSHVPSVDVRPASRLSSVPSHLRRLLHPLPLPPSQPHAHAHATATATATATASRGGGGGAGPWPLPLSRHSGLSGYRVPCSAVVSPSVLKWVDDESVRQQVFLATHSSPPGNHQLLSHLVTMRAQLAHLLGAPSYSHLVNSPLMAGSPATVSAFLHSLAHTLQPIVDEELRMLSSLGSYGTRSRSSSSGVHAPVQVAAWDRSFLAGRAKAQHFDLDGRVLSAYFPLPACIHALSLLSSSLFNLHLTPINPQPGEVWSPSVAKYSLVHPNTGPQGFLYLDLFPRASKFPHAAHFTLRCARRRSTNATHTPTHTSHTHSGHQLPVVALVCNFGLPPSSSSTFSSHSSPCLLSHSDVEVLFHEFGHAMHSLLSRTHFQHLSGTRAPLDLVEVPSILFEYFAWDPSFLSLFARHYSTGDPMPTSLINSLTQSKRFLAATDLQTQAVYSLLDHHLHSYSLSTSHSHTNIISSATVQSSPSLPPDACSLFSSLQHQFLAVPLSPSTHWPTRFSHLTGYGGAYYTYLTSRCVSSLLWATLFSSHPLDEAAGSALQSQLLSHGGACNPHSTLSALLPPSSFVSHSHSHMDGTRMCKSINNKFDGDGDAGVYPCIESLLKELHLK